MRLREPQKPVPLIVAALVLALAPAANAEMSPIFGPKTFARDAKLTKVFIDRFQSCETAAGYKIIILNGNPDGTNRVRKAKVVLNGTKIIGARDFNPRATDLEDDDPDYERETLETDANASVVPQIEKTISVLPTNQIEIRLKGKQAAFLTIKIECIANCLDINILSPPASSNLDSSTILVTGSVHTSSDEFGVTVNAVPALTQGNQFAALEIPLLIGTNPITAIVRNACLNQASTTVSVQTNALLERSATLLANPDNGIAPKSVTLTVLAPTAEGIIEWDFDGDGRIDTSGLDLFETSHKYETPGLFFPKAHVTNSQGERQSAVAVVAIAPPAEVESLGQKRWDSFKKAFTAGDLEAALLFFSPTVRDQYRDAFVRFRRALLVILSQQQEFRFVELRGRYLFYELVIEDDEGQRVPYRITFSPEGEGIWRIVTF